MNESQIFLKIKKILIYGLGKTGISAFNFLKKDNYISLFDDVSNLNLNKILRKKLKSITQIQKKQFDIIILSPGIDINKYKLKKFLKTNQKKIYTDLDIFFSNFKNLCITITGTNGKSTTCQLLYEVFKKQGLDVKLTGSIGYPILSTKNIKQKQFL